MASANWRALCAEAKRSLAVGRRNEARRLAHQAAKAAPDQEEPWLILAAMAAPKASRGYLKQALAINPRSQRAIKGLRWADERAAGKSFNSSDGAAEATLVSPRVNLLLAPLAILAAAFAMLAWMRPPEMDESVRAISAAAAHQLDQVFATETPTETPTPTSTLTPTYTPTPLPTNTPTETLTPSETPSPSPTPTSTAEFLIEKYFLEIPNGISDEERWIEVNLTNQTLSAYEGGDLIKSFTISSGRPNTPTVVGEFKVWAKVRIQAMSGPGYYIENVPWVMYFYGDYGIHGTWWHNNFGTPMSAGCVNMTIADAQWMYNWASIGTVVYVHY
jgi:lipoprotein-anchoring transpeptidase ErfK/SrfK